MQKIFFGAPGTGKSYKIDTEIIANVDKEHVFRVTFYPDYSYSDFTGQLLPKVRKGIDNQSDDIITYEFQKGIFTQALEKSYEDNSKDVYLIIEEMSRGDCSAIFGDIFQLLDRKKSGVDKGYSRYFINNDMISKDIIALNGNEVRLPANFHILGTVNTSDQNVFVMDTAFKRRFDWEYVSTDPVKLANNEYKNNIKINIYYDDTYKEISWVDLYQKINEFISFSQYLDLGEDKQIGPFFIEFDENESIAHHKKQIQNKLLFYLWNDIHKASFKSDISLFKSNIKNYKNLYDEYENDKQIFSNDFIKLII